jgi:predicted  nucleic acid-binding Zn-ribbon protein
MSTDKVTSGALVKLHRIHRQLGDLRGRRERGPKQITHGEAAVAKKEEELKAAKEALTKAKVKADDLQLQLRQREGRIADLQSKLNAATSNKEYQAIREQIAADKQANSVLTDEILEMLERIEELERKLKEADAAVHRSRDELKGLTQRVEGERAMLDSEIERLSGELHQAENDLPGALKAEYKRLSESRGEDALAAVENEVCTGCYTTITVQMKNELVMHHPIFCKSCGRLLYLPEE